jgi:hypothetical protein
MKRQDRFAAVDLEALPWVTPKLPNGDPKGIRYRGVFQGGDGFPQVHLNAYDPHWIEARHRHLEDEVLTLLQGDLTIEGVTHRAPAVIFVGRGTLYGPLEAGAEGALFLRVAYTEAMIQTAPAAPAAVNAARTPGLRAGGRG